MLHNARKRFGQNFLQDKNIIHNIIAAINPQPQQHLVEIGPGLGALTQELLKFGIPLDVIEIDRDLAAQLQVLQNERLIIHTADVLEFDFTQLHKSPLRIVGNLPYNISTPLLFHLISYNRLIADLHFMLQKEVVERICAAVNSTHYGRLSVMLQYYFQCTLLFTVPPTAFKPQPKVESAVIRLMPHAKQSIITTDETLLSQLVKLSFMHRRKTIANNLKRIINSVELEQLQINPQSRPQELTVAEYVKLTNYLVDQERKII